MKFRSLAIVLTTLAAFALAEASDAARRRPKLKVLQTPVVTSGFVESHTPGSGSPDAFTPTPTVEAILGANPNLNQVNTLRTRMRRPDGLPPQAPPRVVLILVPGFLGGAATFDPVARDLVRQFNGQLEVWAVDRRSNQLEDRRGALHARAGMEAGADAGDPALTQQALEEGVRFYFSPVDLDGDQVPDPPFELPDAGGGNSSFLRLEQDDLRFAAYWGVDTHVRDWKLLVEEARALVGDSGLVLFGGHSLGTTWAGVFAAYDFDPGPGVQAAHDLIDGLLLLEGGGPGAPSAQAPDLPTYLATIDDLATPGGSAVYLTDLFGFGIDPVQLGNAGELSGLAGTFVPAEEAILKQTNLFGGFPLFVLFAAPMTNRTLVGLFLDDDFSANAAFSASMGFTDNGPNSVIDFLGNFYIAQPSPTGLRTWKNFDDPTLPTCPPNNPVPGPGEVGCAILDNGPKPAPGDPPAIWGVEREVTDIGVLMKTLYETVNASEWYFVSGRPFLDLSFGRDSSSLMAPNLLNVTQNASMDVPVLAIGGSNGLATTEASFADYLGSVATPPEDQEIVILEGYAHLDPISATDNEAAPAIADWIIQLLQRKLPPGGS